MKGFQKGQIVWNKGLPKEMQPNYGKHPKFSDLTKERMRNAKINNPVRYWLGKKREDISDRLRKANLGKHHLDETKRKMSETHKRNGGGKWNLGRKDSLETIEKKRLASTGRKMPSWFSEFTRRNNLGKKRSLETRKLQSEVRKEYIRNHPEELERLKGFRMTNIIPKKDTSIEIRIQDFLTLLNIEYFTHKYMNIENAYQCDILIPIQSGINQKTIIECDGDYFHGNLNKFSIEKLSERIKNNRLLDVERTKQLQEKGYKVIRLWGSQINSMQLNDFQKVLQ